MLLGKREELHERVLVILRATPFAIGTFSSSRLPLGGDHFGIANTLEDHGGSRMDTRGPEQDDGKHCLE